jgi:hypothetical protein
LGDAGSILAAGFFRARGQPYIEIPFLGLQQGGSGVGKENSRILHTGRKSARIAKRKFYPADLPPSMSLYSPIAALNRTYALAKTSGKEAAIAEALKLNLPDNPFYYALLGELYRDIDDEKARQSLHTALSLARTATDRQTIQKKLKDL